MTIEQLIEYMKIHLISLSQDQDELTKTMTNLDENSKQYKDLDFHRYRKFFKSDFVEEFENKEVAVESVNEQTSNMVLVDVKGILNKKEAEEYGYMYWRL